MALSVSNFFRFKDMKLDIFDDGKYSHLKEERMKELLFQINRFLTFFQFSMVSSAGVLAIR